MLLLAIVGLGLFAGAVAQLVLGTGVYDINWAEAIVAGLVGSFVGGLLASLIAGDGIQLRPSGTPTSTSSTVLPRNPGGIVMRRIGASSALISCSVTARAQTSAAGLATTELRLTERIG